MSLKVYKTLESRKVYTRMTTSGRPDVCFRPTEIRRWWWSSLCADTRIRRWRCSSFGGDTRIQRWWWCRSLGGYTGIQRWVPGTLHIRWLLREKKIQMYLKKQKGNAWRAKKIRREGRRRSNKSKSTGNTEIKFKVMIRAYILKFSSSSRCIFKI